MKIWLAVLLFVLLIGLSVWWSLSVWSECRHTGHSVLYCLKMVSK